MNEMDDFKQKRLVRNVKRRIYSLPVLFLLAVALFFAAQNVWSVGGKAYDTKQDSENAETKLVELQERETHLETQIAQMKEPFGIEAEIREKYGYIKEGEEMVIVTDERKKEYQEENKMDESKTVWDTVIDWF